MPGPNKPALNALEILHMFVTDDVMSAVVERTNEHVASEAGRPAKRKRQRENKNIEKEITSAEPWIFISVLIPSDIHDKPAVRDNWSTNALLNTPAFSQIISDFRQEEIVFCETIRRWAKTPVQIALGGLGVLLLRSLLNYFKLGS